MRRHQSTVLPGLLALFLMGSTAYGQSATLSQEQNQKAQDEIRKLQDAVRKLAAGVQQGPGVRGGAPVEQYQATINQYQTAVLSQLDAIRRVVRLAPNDVQGGAWWTNAALVMRLGLTDEQKTRIARAYENHRQNLVSDTALLEKEEAQLARLLEADPTDRNAVLTQVDHVVQARGEMERVNSAMTLEMRESLTRAQWTQLQTETANQKIMYWNQAPLNLVLPPASGGGRGAAPALPPAAGPGQRRGPGQP